jgi:predicted HTH transcriptional regulator
MAQLLNVSRYTVIRDMKELTQKGVISKNGYNGSGAWKVLKT